MDRTVLLWLFALILAVALTTICARLIGAVGRRLGATGPAPGEDRE
ncbi:hypothetical protein [Phenylobacterium zucineum]|nr:hypothetical protein [Phenylobacterium zucineum]